MSATSNTTINEYFPASRISAFIFIATITSLLAIKIVSFVQSADRMNFSERINNMASVTRNLYVTSSTILTREKGHDPDNTYAINAADIFKKSGWAKNFFPAESPKFNGHETVVLPVKGSSVTNATGEDVAKTDVKPTAADSTQNNGLVYLTGGGDVYVGAIYRYTTFAICMLTLVLLVKMAYEAYRKRSNKVSAFLKDNSNDGAKIDKIKTGG